MSPTQLKYLPQLHDDAVTRSLCHAVQVDENFRALVRREVTGPRAEALCPSFGVDLGAVARHSAQAARRGAVQSGGLIAVRALLAGSIALIPLSAETGATAGSLSLLIGWYLIAARFYADQRAGLRALTDRKPARDQAPPLSAAIEARFADLERSNVIVYSTRRDTPFAGAGTLSDTFQFTPIDVTVARRDSQGRAQRLIPFDAIKLHGYLAKHVPLIGFDGLSVRNRLYVRGDMADAVTGLIQNSYGPPLTRLDDQGWVKGALNNPTPYARTFLCMERILFGGELVICMYVRAWLEQNLLSIERTISILTPLDETALPPPSVLRRRPVSIALVAAGRGLSRLFPLLLNLSAPTRRFRKGAAERQIRRTIRLGLGHDYGAEHSLRELLAADEIRNHNQLVEVVDSVKRLQNRLWDCIDIFLADHGIDNGEFANQLSIVNHNTVININTLNSGNTTFGNNNQINAPGKVNVNRRTPRQQTGGRHDNRPASGSGPTPRRDPA